ncbi:MAG: hypothetical protein WC570_04705 [Patescibacteria group bacterium]
MERLLHFARLMIYVMVMVVIYLGVNQVLIIASGKTNSLLGSFNLINLVWAKDGGENENDRQWAKVIDDYLAQKQSPLSGLGGEYVTVAHKYDLPVYLMVAMAGAESGFGKYGYAQDNTFNPVGLGIHEGRRYENWAESIEDTGYVLRTYYFDEGRVDTVAIQNKWAPRCTDGNACHNSWADNVDYFMAELEAWEEKSRS